MKEFVKTFAWFQIPIAIIFSVILIVSSIVNLDLTQYSKDIVIGTFVIEILCIIFAFVVAVDISDYDY